MKPVLNENEQTHYVSVSDIISFIEKNSEMEWNYVCDFVRKVGIISDCEDTICWESDSIHYQGIDPETEFWIKAFFEAHPWIKRMMIVFDD